MSIEDHFNTLFNLYVKSRSKVGGQYVTSYVKDAIDYFGGIFTPSTIRTVRVGKEDYVILKNLYCSVSVPVSMGDYIEIDSGEFEVGNIKNTNNLNHHYQLELISRII